MYFEEQMIDGILQHRNTPDGEFTAHTVKELSAPIAMPREGKDGA